MAIGLEKSGLSAILLAASVLTLSAQMPGPPPGGPPPPFARDPQRAEDRIARVEQQSRRLKPADADQRELASFAARFLEQARKSLKQGDHFAADRFALASDACQRPIEISGRLNGTLDEPEQSRPPFGPGFKHGRPPGFGWDRGFGEDPLRRVYFRLQLCDYFLEHIPEPKPQRLLQIARGYYQQALQANEGSDKRRMMAYIISTESLTRALENLAQVYAPPPPPPPPPARSPQP